MKRKFAKFSILLTSVMAISLLQGCAQEKKEISEASKKQAEILWSFDTGGSITSSPVKFEENIIIGSNNKNLYSISTSTYEPNWTFESDESITSTPLVCENNTVFSTDSCCYALDARTGKEIWNFKSQEIAKESVGAWNFHSPSPSIYKDLVIFTARTGKIYGLNKGDGSKIWEYKSEESSDVVATPTIQDNILVMGDIKGNCFAVDLDTQKTLWNKSIGYQIIHGSLAYKDYGFFCGRDTNLVAFNLKTGEEKWKFTEPIASWLTGNIAAKDDMIYVPGSDNIKVTEFKYDTGDKGKNFTGKGNIFSTPTIAEDYIYFTGGDAYHNQSGFVYGYELGNKNENIFECIFDKPIYSSPLIIDDVLYVGSTDGSLYALDAQLNK